MNDAFENDIERIGNWLRQSRRVLFVTGAGMSADSGLPTYRGIGGLYNDGMTEDGIPIEMALAGEMLQSRPEITWKYLAQIERNCRGASFNRGHEIIAALQSYAEIWVLTQNIDGFHQAAGSRNVIDIHGDMHELSCVSCGHRLRVDTYEGLSIPPRCECCRGIMRPEVVFFGEMLPEQKVWQLQHQLARGFDLYFSIGTTSVFPYISQPIIQAVADGRPAIEINPDETEVSGLVPAILRLRAGEALTRIWEAMPDE